MAEVKEKETFVNPYVIQMDKFADSLMHLSDFGFFLPAAVHGFLSQFFVV